MADAYAPSASYDLLQFYTTCAGANPLAQQITDASSQVLLVRQNQREHQKQQRRGLQERVGLQTKGARKASASAVVQSAGSSRPRR
jgi:hypothetical protein